MAATTVIASTHRNVVGPESAGLPGGRGLVAELAGEDDGERGGADRAADALEDVELRGGVEDLVRRQGLVGGGHRRDDRQAEPNAPDDHDEAQQPWARAYLAGDIA